MKLFGSPGSPFSRKVRIVLAEHGIPYEYIVSAPRRPIRRYRSGTRSARCRR